MRRQPCRSVFYSAGPRIYGNGLREVTAIYHTHDLADGFTVTFAEVNGSEWSFEVSADDAENELLLKGRSRPFAMKRTATMEQLDTPPACV
jgi:hypothetical protein